MKKNQTRTSTKTYNKTPTKNRLKSKGKCKLYKLADDELSEKKKLIVIQCPNCSHHFKAPPAPSEPLLQQSSISVIH